MKMLKKVAGNIVLSSSLLLVSSHAVSDEGVPYIGGQLGYGWSNLNDDSSARGSLEGLSPGIVQSFSHSTNTGGVGGRVYGGYMFNELVGLEVGFAAYNQGKSSAEARILEQNIELSATNNVTAIDALGVYRVPLVDRVSLNLKAGIAYVMNKYEVHSSVNGGESFNEGSQSAHTIRPKFAVGADYYLTDNFAIGAAYEITPGTGEPFNVSGTGEEIVAEGNNKYAPTLQLFTVNVMYRFK